MCCWDSPQAPGLKCFLLFQPPEYLGLQEHPIIPSQNCSRRERPFWGDTYPWEACFCQGQDGFPVSWDFTSSSVFTSFCASICSHLKKRVYTEAPNRLFSCLLLQNRKIIWWETFLNAVGYVRSELFPPKHLKWRTIPHHYPRLCILLVQRNCPQCQQGRLLASKMALSLDCFSLET